ncbi:MAG: hypothetical protein EOP84_19535 [Verrucomicrobiaceae bacterium]|nr:MAG: hypothetical protein EOP84_19535 [Verrucomicrobiaceae bacterium]
MSEPFEAEKKQVRDNIAAILKGPEPMKRLVELQAKAHAQWGGQVSQFIQGQEVVSAIARRAGVEVSPEPADALHFPNWVMDQIRRAIKEREE